MFRGSQSKYARYVMRLCGAVLCVNKQLRARFWHGWMRLCMCLLYINVSMVILLWNGGSK